MPSLARLLNPKSIALIGGSWTQNVRFQLERLGFGGPIWQVNPKAEFKTVADLPEAPDATFIAVNRHAAIDVTAALAARGAGGPSALPLALRRRARKGLDCKAHWSRPQAPCLCWGRIAMAFSTIWTGWRCGPMSMAADAWRRAWR